MKQISFKETFNNYHLIKTQIVIFSDTRRQFEAAVEQFWVFAANLKKGWKLYIKKKSRKIFVNKRMVTV